MKRIALALILALVMGCGTAGNVMTLGDATAALETGDGVTVDETFDTEGNLIGRSTHYEKNYKRQAVDSRNPKRNFEAWIAAGVSLLATVLMLSF